MLLEPDEHLLSLMTAHLHRKNSRDSYNYRTASLLYGEFNTVEAAKQLADTNRLLDPEYHQALTQMLEEEPYHRQSFYLYSRDSVVKFRGEDNNWPLTS